MLVISVALRSERLICRRDDRNVENKEQHSYPVWLAESLTRVRVTTRVPMQGNRRRKLLEDLATRQRPENPGIVIDVAPA